MPAAALICGGSVAAGVAGGVGFASIAGGLLVEAVAVVGLIAWMLTFGLSRRPGRPDSIPVVLGLNRADRRTVYRDLRSGRPSDDWLLLAVECRTASRAVQRQHLRWTPNLDPLLREVERWTIAKLSANRMVVWIVPPFAILGAVLAIAPRDAAADQIFWVVAAVVFAFQSVQLMLVLRRADRFLT